MNLVKSKYLMVFTFQNFSQMSLAEYVQACQTFCSNTHAQPCSPCARTLGELFVKWDTAGLVKLFTMCHLELLTWQSMLLIQTVRCLCWVISLADFHQSIQQATNCRCQENFQQGL